MTLQVRVLGRDYLTGEQMRRHRAILEGTAKAPYQYRIFSEYLLAGVLSVLYAVNLQQAVILAFVGVRIAQNMLIFLLAAWYYNILGLRIFHILLGLALLAWGMSHAYYNSDLAVNTYFDIIFYVSAMLLIHYRLDVWILPLMVLSALNRETCGLIPAMLAVVRYPEVRQQRFHWLKLLGTVGVAYGLYVCIFWGVRLYWGPRELSVPDGLVPGFDFLLHNLNNKNTWIQLAATFNILPILAALSWHQWPVVLKKLFWTIIPVWVIIHLAYSMLAETRLLLVPLVLVIVPGVLWGISSTELEHVYA